MISHTILCPVIVRAYPHEALFLWRSAQRLGARGAAERLGLSLPDYYSIEGARTLPTDETRKVIERVTDGALKAIRWTINEPFDCFTEIGFAVLVLRRRAGVGIVDIKRVLGVSIRRVVSLEDGQQPTDDLKEKILKRFQRDIRKAEET